MAEKVIEVKDLVISFKTDHGILHAVRGVSFDLYRGETLCIVGESGSGKSVTSKTIMGILAANAIIEGGSIIYRGENLLEVAEEEFHKIRGHKIGMIFQDPLSSLNPIVRIGKQITEATLINSNKLKLMYEDLISDDLIAYKNCLARSSMKEKAVLSEYEKQLVDLRHKTGEDAPNKEEKKQIKANLKKEKKEALKEIKAIKKETAVEAAPLKAKLNETKKEARIKVKEYKKQVINEYNAAVKECKAKNANDQVALKEE